MGNRNIEMVDEEPIQSEVPEQFILGDNLNWDAPWETVTLCVELPFWLMVPDCTVDVSFSGHVFQVAITEHYCQVHGMHITDSLETCSYQGPYPPPKDVLQTALTSGVATMLRKCKTVLRVKSRCNADVCAAASDNNVQRRRSAQLYLVSLCSAHIPVLNCLLRSYILQTYDPGVHEVAPWDVPIWFLSRAGGEGTRVIVQDTASWDLKPQVVSWRVEPDAKSKEGRPFQFATAKELEDGLVLDITPGEPELALGMHLRERGDYSGAVRRSVTALEILLEDRLGIQLGKKYAPTEVEQRLRASRNDFPGRWRQYQALSGRTIPDGFWSELETIRELRHSIVHCGRSLTFEERGLANQSIDIARFIFQWLENSEIHRTRREKLLVQRQLGMHMTAFPSEITSEGIVIRMVG